MCHIKAKTEPKNFGDYLKNSLSAEEYELLSDTTKISRHRLTKIKRDATVATYEETRAISAAIGKPINWLIETFRLGFDNITLDQAEIISKEQLNEEVA